MCLATLAFCLQPANAQIAKVIDDGGRRFFINSEPPQTKFSTAKPRATIYLPAESSFTGRSRPAMSIDRDGAEKLGLEAADRHPMAPPLTRTVTHPQSHSHPP